MESLKQVRQIISLTRFFQELGRVYGAVIFPRTGMKAIPVFARPARQTGMHWN